MGPTEGGYFCDVILKPVPGAIRQRLLDDIRDNTRLMFLCGGGADGSQAARYVYKDSVLRCGYLICRYSDKRCLAGEILGAETVSVSK